MDNDDFSKEYVSEEETRYEDEKKEKETDKFVVEDKIYGISKPRRIIIRAKLIHDKD